MADSDNRATVGAMMLLAGGVIGAGLGLLFAPHSGRKTRNQIARSTRRVRNQAEEMVRDAAHTVTEAVEDLGEKTASVIERGGEVAEDWREHLLDSIERGQKRLAKERQRLTQKWS